MNAQQKQYIEQLNARRQQAEATIRQLKGQMTPEQVNQADTPVGVRAANVLNSIETKTAEAVDTMRVMYAEFRAQRAILKAERLAQQ